MKATEKALIFLSGFVFILLYLIIFKPVYSYGDGTVYINYAKTIAEGGNTIAYIHRSPLLPFLLSLIIKPLGIEKTVRIAVILNYILIYFSGIILFFIVYKYLFKKYLIAFFNTILFYLNFSVIFYGYVVLTEAFTLFLVMLSIWFLINMLYSTSVTYPILCGITVSAAILCRFNILPIIPVFIFSVLLIELLISKSGINIIIKKILLLIFPILIVLNAFAFFNYKKNGFYGLFPTGGSLTVSRNAIIASIKGDEPVSDCQKEILKIFIKAKEEFNKRELMSYKASLIIPGRDHILRKLTSGFSIYSLALPELCNYFGIDPKTPEPELSQKLNTFYREVININKEQIWGLRFLSFLGSFLSSSGLVIPDQPDLNLGKMPVSILIGYKIFIPVFSVLVFIGSIIYLIITFLKMINPNEIVLIFILIFSGFFFINFAFATVIDAARFKFPAEPFVFSLGVYYLYQVLIFIKNKLSYTYHFK